MSKNIGMQKINIIRSFYKKDLSAKECEKIIEQQTSTWDNVEELTEYINMDGDIYTDKQVLAMDNVFILRDSKIFTIW